MRKPKIGDVWRWHDPDEEQRTNMFLIVSSGDDRDNSLVPLWLGDNMDGPELRVYNTVQALEDKVDEAIEFVCHLGVDNIVKAITTIALENSDVDV